MKIAANEIHVWTIPLTSEDIQEQSLQALLNTHEINRANRFRFNIHKQRFIVSHGLLRLILSNYLNILPKDILFSYQPQKKPYLQINPLNLQFNLSHSNDIAILAITQNHAIGVDIEKIRTVYHADLPKRFFSEEENAVLKTLDNKERISTFYKIWSHKEAIVKALGSGLSLPLSRFSISPNYDSQAVSVNGSIWQLISLFISDGYHAAVATSNPSVQSIAYWQYVNQTPMLARTALV